MNFGQGHSCIYASENPQYLTPISEEQIKEVADFLNLLINASNNE